MNRRAFMGNLAAGFAAGALGQTAPARPRLGIDVFSIRSQNWTPFEYLDYCARWKAEVVLFSEIRFLGGLEEAHLEKVRAHADRLGIALEIGDRSICPTSHRFDPSLGAAEEQLTNLIEAARITGSPLVRCFIGSAQDRKTHGGIGTHIANTVKVLRSVRSRALDVGVKIAVENHAGDMQGWELRNLIEEAGADFVGAVIDSGNATWTLEDPFDTLEALAPYCLTTGIRDSALWRVPEGVAVEWVRMGEGNVDMERWARRFFELCPGRTFALEIICLPPRTFAVFDRGFWPGYENLKAESLARFLALAEKGQPRPAVPPVAREMAAAREREDLEASIRFCRNVLGL